ncbi:hypothetical protein N8703_03315 [Verrucomicrobia bacterium]|nr:hypothetical protein [Verrucomicrobiota bacterium]
MSACDKRPDVSTQQATMLLLVCCDPRTDERGREGLRCALGLATDSRWTVSIGFCECGKDWLESTQASGDGWQDLFPGASGNALQNFEERIFTLLSPQRPKRLGEGVVCLDASEWLSLGLRHDFIMTF